MSLSSKVPAWIERKFDFTFPAEQYPNVCVRLWGTPARLEEILHKVTTDVLIGKPQEKCQPKSMRATCSISNLYGWRV